MRRESMFLRQGNEDGGHQGSLGNREDIQKNIKIQFHVFSEIQLIWKSIYQKKIKRS